ncbi:MAG TPA: sugar ABC transporter permease [Phototrophicaceae bacterium]|nr:sugar ABC transporter permease [Phototrophicaceae bacterium]
MASLATAPQRRSRWARYEGYLFIAPLFIGIFAFVLIPILVSLVMSFTKWDFVTPPEFVGIQNYIQMVTRDRLFWKVLGNTFRYVLLSVPLSATIPLILSVLLNQKVPGVTLYRIAFFLPLVTSVVAIGLLWRWMYDSDFGLINYILQMFGIQGPHWLSDTNLAMPAVVFATVWQGLGYNIIIYLAGLQGIPEQLYEAATIDGAGDLQKFFRITIPLLTPQIFFVLVVSFIGGFQSFGLIYVMTQGGPVNSTNVYVYYLWQTAFSSAKMGYASALSWVLTLILVVATYAQVKLSRRWVYY